MAARRLRLRPAAEILGEKYGPGEPFRALGGAPEQLQLPVVDWIVEMACGEADGECAVVTLQCCFILARSVGLYEVSALFSFARPGGCIFLKPAFFNIDKPCLETLEMSL